MEINEVYPYNEKMKYILEKLFFFLQYRHQIDIDRLLGFF